MEFKKHNYGKDFGALRSVLGLSVEELSKMISLKPEAIELIEDSEDFFNISEDSIFKIYYLGKIVEEDANIYLQNSTITRLASIVAERSKRVIKSKAKEKEMVEIKRQYDELNGIQNKITIPEVLNDDYRESIRGLAENNFMDLLLSTMIVRDYQPPIIDRYELETDLKMFKGKDHYQRLFANIKTNENGNLDLENAFRNSTSSEELVRISSGLDNEIYLINITEEEAKKHIKYYNEEDVINMIILVDRLKERSQERERVRGPIYQKIQTVTKYAA